MKVRAEELQMILSELPSLTEYPLGKTEKSICCLNDDGTLHESRSVTLYFTVNIEKDGWDMIMPTVKRQG